MDNHVVVGGVGEGCKWAKSSQTLCTLQRVYFKPIDHECLYELKTNHLMPRQEKYQSKSRFVVTLSSEFKQMTSHVQ